MGLFLIRRGASSLSVLALSVVMVFLSIRILPGDPVLARLGAATEVTPEALAALREEAGLNRPLLAQLLDWIGDAFRGDLGVSYISQFPVTQLVAERIPVTLELTFFIILIAVILALILAPLSTLKPGISEDVLENLKLMLLPAVTGGLTATPYLVRYLRASMLEVKQSPFVRTAEGKGISSGRILFRHVLPNSLIPTLTMLGLIVGYTLSGVVVIEYMFGLPGIGSLAIESSFKRDYAVIQGVALTIISFFILTTFLFDVLCGIVDPRLRLAKVQKSEI